MPVIGALGGAAVNYAFIDHFQEVARAHFVVRRLERRYGKDAVRTAYERLSGATAEAASRHRPVHRAVGQPTKGLISRE